MDRPRVHTLHDVAAILGCNERTLRNRRQGDRIVFESGHELRCIRTGARTWVPEAELARFLGESNNSDRPMAPEGLGGDHGSGGRADGLKGPSGARSDHRNTSRTAAGPSSTSGTAA